jgi:hypothetical protein
LELSRTRREVARWEIREAVIAATDAKTGAPLEPHFTYSMTTPMVPNRFGFTTSSETEGNFPKRRLRWVSADPMIITVGADGYEQQTVTVGDSNLSSAVTVALNRKNP